MYLLFEMPEPIRILLLADSHLGFDLPTQPRVARRRRGDDFLANYAAALAPAMRGEVDLVVHGGDVFDRPRVPPSLAYQAFEPLVRVADRGVPVFLVPGNHERASFPHMRFARHRAIHIFDHPRTVHVNVRGEEVAIAGFAYERRVRDRFVDVLERTNWRASRARVRVLCMHHCVEGATVGPGNFTFRTASDVIRGSDIPSGFAAVFSGHIHRHQVLTQDMRRRRLSAPVLYPGSIERTSYAERDEEKGFLLVEVSGGEPASAVWQFQPLPARPMVLAELETDGMQEHEVEPALRALVATAPPDAVLRLGVQGALNDGVARCLSASNLRRLAPATMNIDVRIAGAMRRRRSV
jgi:DNA repair exonuclease SbcCD nuclease subunit